MDLIEQPVVHQLLLHVVRDAQQHRPRLVRIKRLRGLAEHLREVVGAFDKLAIAGDASKKFALVDCPAFARTLLQPPLAEDIGRGLAGDHKDRQLLRIGIGNPGDEVGRPRPCGRDARGDPVRDACVAARHEGSALLVLDQYGLHSGAIQAIVDRQDVRTGHTEDELDTQAFHVPHDNVADSHFHIDSLLRPVQAPTVLGLIAIRSRRTLAGPTGDSHPDPWPRIISVSIGLGHGHPDPRGGRVWWANSRRTPGHPNIQG